MKKILFLLIIVNSFNKPQGAEAQDTEPLESEIEGTVYENNPNEEPDLQTTIEAWMDSYQYSTQAWQTEIDYAEGELERLQEANADSTRIAVQQRIIARLKEIAGLLETIRQLEAELEGTDDPAKQAQLESELEEKYRDFYLYYYAFQRPPGSVEKYVDEGPDIYKPQESGPPDPEYNYEDDILTQSRERYGGDICEEADSSHICKKQCHQIYREIKISEQCKRFPIAQIAKLFELDEILKNPSDNKLYTISFQNLQDLQVYLFLSTVAFKSNIETYDANQARLALYWIARDKEVAKLLTEESSRFAERILVLLFEKSFRAEFFDRYDSVHVAFIQKISTAKGFTETLIEIAIDVNNEEAMNLFYDYIVGSSACYNGETSLACFTIFCKIGKGTPFSDRLKWLKQFEVFRKYIDYIILAEVNGSSTPTDGQWDTDVFQSSDNVDDFYTQLCGNLAD